MEIDDIYPKSRREPSSIALRAINVIDVIDVIDSLAALVDTFDSNIYLGDRIHSADSIKALGENPQIIDSFRCHIIGDRVEST